MIGKKLCIVFSCLAMSLNAQNLSSGLSKKNMDLAVNPGTDFFEYAGGGWMKAHPLTPEYSRYGQFNQLNQNNQLRIRKLIEDLASHPQKNGSLGQKIGTLYNLAMDSIRRNNEGCRPVLSILDKIKAIRNTNEYQKLCAKYELEGLGTNMYDIGVGADIKNAKLNIVTISQGGLSMGNKDYYLNSDSSTVAIRKAYKSYIIKLFELAGENSATARKKMQDVLAIETEIAKASYSSTKLRDVEGNYHKMTFGELEKQYPKIMWKQVFNILGFPSFKMVCVSQPEPIKEVEKILRNTPLSALKAYAEFKVLDNSANELDDHFRTASFNFYSKAMSGTLQDKPRWKRAVGLVNGVLGMAVGRMYVEKYFPQSSKKRMLELVHNLQRALAERIKGLSWMSEATKKQALDKLSHFYIKIGYPDKWKDYSSLTISPNLSLFDNLRKSSEFEWKYMISQKVNKPTDKNEWLMTPQTINAYYQPTTNEICFPAGILQPPFFNPNADDACNYGAVGVVIGHEMTHGFDDQGAQFDKNGNLRNWWTDQDRKDFKKRTKAMENFFNHIEVLPGMYANGKLTLGENIADNGGLNVAYLALQNAMKKHPLKVIDGYTPNQRFFLSFGLIWADNIRPAQLRVYNKIDPHSPARWRVNGALPQIDAWYEAFHITPKDKLYIPKEKRANVW